MPEDELSEKSLIKDDIPYLIEEDKSSSEVNISSRIIWYKGKLIGAVDRERFSNNLNKKILSEDFYLGDLSEILLDKCLKEKVELISDFLSEKGFVLAEISIFNFKHITKVVVSNPGSIKLYIELSDDYFINK